MDEGEKRRLNKLFHILLIFFSLVIVGYFIYVGNEKVRCNRALLNDSKIVMMYAEESKNIVSIDNGLVVCTIFSTIYQDKKVQVESHAFSKIVPVGMPVYVKYTSECDDCAKIVFDSVINYKGYRYEYKMGKKNLIEFNITQSN